ncbi:MAG: DNA (cytosine-5-)-methyltransferase [Candidatus Krumholzibacteria bacterium]|nr:DNA (cytosine-5-)-methyltransferase [Candidatus Krumholzibacteria bacterium]
MKKSNESKKQPTFIDLFAGIGGIRLAFERAGAQCVFSSEWDRYACKTYEANFGEVPHGDITKIHARDIPDHDILTAGFPCQPFSIAGVTKHNALGNHHGFRHATQGTLFFDVARIIETKRPRAFMLENVKNLTRHDRGKTFAVIRNTLENDLGYTIFWKVLDARAVVPQHRERVYIVGFRDNVDFEFPELGDKPQHFADILEDDVDKKYTLSGHLWNYLRNYARKHKARGNGFGYGLVDLDGVSRTLSARYYKDGSEILIPRGGRRNPRRLTPRECARLMGFPDSYKIVCSDTRAYMQFGNSVVVPVVEQVAKALLLCLEGESKQPRAPRQLRLLEESVAY